MKYIEKFNLDLNNNSYKRYEKWGKYREYLTRFILNSIHENNVNSVTIIGSGNGDDIDLNLIHQKVSQLTLVDVDIESVKRSIKKYQLEQADVDILRVEVTGFELNEFFTTFINTVLKCDDFDCLQVFIDDMFEKSSKYKFMKAYKKHFDMIVISPIYTQLVYQQILYFTSLLRSKNYREDFLKFIEDYTLEKMPIIIDNFNKNIVSSVKEDGIIVSISDIFETPIKSEFYTKIKKKFQKKDIDKVYNNYIHEFGVGLGDYGLISLENDMNLEDYDWLDWPYNDEIHMIVKVALFNRLK